MNMDIDKPGSDHQIGKIEVLCLRRKFGRGTRSHTENGAVLHLENGLLYRFSRRDELGSGDPGFHCDGKTVENETL